MAAAPFKVKAVYEYNSAEPDDLNFPNGQIITVTAVEDDDWYTGSYVDTSGDTKEGLFPKNFVEKYEPAIPSRPKRAQPKAEAPVEVPVFAPQEADAAPSRKSVEVPRPSEPEPIPATSPPAQATLQSPSPATPEAPVAAAKPAGGKPPPPIAEKPNSGSFRDRIAAFNKTAAPPPTPFKPATQNNSTGFIKKPFVAPPPSKNAYVPPPREQPPPKIYRRDEDPEMAREEPTTAAERAAEVSAATPEDEEDAPKPMTLRERMALLQKQQLEQAQRHAEGGQKKEKAKRPPKKRVESTENIEAAEAGAGVPLERVQTDETVGKKSVDFADDEAGPLRGNSKSSHDRNAVATPPPPSRELVSDTNDADDSGAGDTEDAQETSTEEERPKSRHGTGDHVPGAFTDEPESTTHQRQAEAADEDEEEADDTDEDPEVKRRREIRDRMAKMSGGMGMMGMFGPPAMSPVASSTRQPRVSGDRDRQVSSQQTQDDERPRAPPVPIMAMPVITKRPPPPAEEEEDNENESVQPTSRETVPRELSDGDDDPPAPLTHKSTERAAPPIPQERGLPPPPPRDARPIPPPLPSERSSDFASAPPPPSRATRPAPTEEITEKPRPQSRGGPPGLPPAPPRRPTEPPRLDTSPPVSPSTQNKRLSREPPPIPMMSPNSPQNRGPPPPPPGQPPSRRNTNDSRGSSTRYPNDDGSAEETTEYDGDYDTDIASGVQHKSALNSHNRDSSFDEDILTDEAATKSSTSPPARAMPSAPITSALRDVPPPLPPQSAPKRTSSDAPRAAPPPVPPPKEMDGEEYDPFRYSQPATSPPSRSIYAPVLASPAEEMQQDSIYDPTPTATRSIPQPPLSTAPMMSGGLGRPSMEAPRASMQDPRGSMNDRRSTEQLRDHGIMASDIDLGLASMWWTQANTPPPSLQSRQDVLYEVESSTSTKRGGKASTSTDVYVLYSDYSQTTVNCTFSPSDPQHASIEQKHDRPPAPPRKDQLEDASSQFGSVIASSAASKLNTTVSDGTPQSFILELLRPLSARALMPIGTRSFGALVYANLANTSTQVFDEIRPGDVVTFRNAKFSGKHGAMHQKYSADAGTGGREHVAVVAEWDGTKKKIRVWEQGREKEGKKGKVKEESWRMGDLRSGEVRVFRVMGRGWVGWDSGK